MSLKHVLDILNQIESTPKRLKKEAIIEANKNDTYFEMVVRYALDPLKRYKITSLDENSIENNPDIETSTIFEHLDLLSRARGVSDNMRRDFTRSVCIDEETCEVVRRILNKDLRCGAAVKLFRKTFKDLPCHEVMLASNDLEKYFKAAGNDPNIMCWSTKLDGVRCWAIVPERGRVVYLSRKGLEFPNFEKFDKTLKHLAELLQEKTDLPYPFIFDGEVHVSNDAGFQVQMTQLRRLKEADPSLFIFSIFDIVLHDRGFGRRYSLLEYLEKKSDLIGMQGEDKEVQVVRHNHLVDVLMPNSKDVDPQKVLAKFDGDVDLPKLIASFNEEAMSEGYEGLVLKTWTHKYEGKRSPHWCKVKEFHTEDLQVKGIIEGSGKYRGTLGALVCDFEGVEVKVGSGFNEAERDEFFHTPPSMIEVRYQEKTKDGSLRFPTFIRVRDDK